MSDAEKFRLEMMSTHELSELARKYKRQADETIDKAKKLKHLLLTIDEYLNHIVDDDHDETFLPLYRAQEAIEKKLGKTAHQVFWSLA